MRQETDDGARQITDLEEVLKLGWTLLLGVLCVEQNVGLGFQHSLLTDQSDRAVVEVVPSALVTPVCRVMSWADAVGEDRDLIICTECELIKQESSAELLI